MSRGRKSSGDVFLSAAELCSYIADLAAELQRLARGNGLVVLAALLNLVNAEAERQARERRASASARPLIKLIND
jgi:hypothetical protein